ncbi:hypothetical protein BKP45_15250 [Anaerobacillus alkalidiazotrophicus]|uniref:Uncharacterized protein n=1 Tax=Anaerobacillus alkalidiazotrophicus TaxID=472963 RepID=A0A1S2M2N9_9BACI|nr:hypothetical protein [Anaerobacillus alkalidiazotrophicus]OIJ18884.1 hypothetical protein BKP45_15250 [Anaerobacillus alkalidiazotrophicus]
MQTLIVISAMFLMPIFSFVFLRSLFLVIKFIKEENEQKRDNAIITTCFFFALIMWTFSSSILMIGNW